MVKDIAGSRGFVLGGMFPLHRFPQMRNRITQDTQSSAELRFALLTVATNWDALVMARTVSWRAMGPLFGDLPKTEKTRKNYSIQPPKKMKLESQVP